MLKHFANAKNMIGVADGDAAGHMIGPHDHGDSLGRFCSIGSVRFSDESRFGHSAMHQVIVPDSPFAEIGISGRAAGCDYRRGEPLPEQLVSMVEAGAIYRRRAAVILGCAKDHYGVSVKELLLM